MENALYFLITPTGEGDFGPAHVQDLRIGTADCRAVAWIRMSA
jgi:hypothetical protein